MKNKIAFIKFGGLAAGGTERFLHAIAANLPKQDFDVDFYYCDSAPYIGSDWIHPNTDPFRKKYLEENGVNLIKFNVQYKDIRTPTHVWINTNFWSLFNEEKYDVVVSGRAGHPEYPFTEIKHVPIINILTLIAGVDNQTNIFKTIQISNWSGEKWVAQGGDKNRLEIISLFQKFPDISNENMRSELNLENKFIYGFHQRDTEQMFSPIPLNSYKLIESDDTCFLLLGGSSKYKEQALNLNLKNFINLKHTGDEKIIHSFLETIDVFSHGRKDGETFGAVFVEAFYHKKPIISHLAEANGHVEVIADGGVVLNENDIDSYAKEMKKLKNDREYYLKKSEAGYNRYVNNYSIENQMKKIINLFNDAKKHGKY